MESFAKINSSWKTLAIFAKLSSLDVWQGSEYASISAFLLLNWIWEYTDYKLYLVRMIKSRIFSILSIYL